MSKLDSGKTLHMCNRVLAFAARICNMFVYITCDAHYFYINIFELKWIMLHSKIRTSEFKTYLANLHAQVSCVRKKGSCLGPVFRPFLISNQYSFQKLLYQMDISTFS